MPYGIERVEIWSAQIDDKPGAVAAALLPLAESGANLAFVHARRDTPGHGIVFVAPVKGASAARAARKAGFAPDASLEALRIEGTDKGGIGAAITCALAEAGVNLRALSATAAGRKMVMHLAFDNKADAAKARDLLKRLLKVK